MIFYQPNGIKTTEMVLVNTGPTISLNPAVLMGNLDGNVNFSVVVKTMQHVIQ
jgi:hypothetical protein